MRQKPRWRIALTVLGALSALVMWVTYENKTTTQTRWIDQREDSKVPTLIVKAKVKDSEREFTLPPFGEFDQRTRDRVSKLFEKSQLDETEHFTWNWCLKNYALTPWRFGLQPYRHEWSLEELP